MKFRSYLVNICAIVGVVLMVTTAWAQPSVRSADEVRNEILQHLIERVHKLEHKTDLMHKEILILHGMVDKHSDIERRLSGVQKQVTILHAKIDHGACHCESRP